MVGLNDKAVGKWGQDQQGEKISETKHEWFGCYLVECDRAMDVMRWIFGG
jgi:hypothetical protein